MVSIEDPRQTTFSALLAAAIGVCILAANLGCGGLPGRDSQSRAKTLTSLSVSSENSSVVLGNNEQFVATGIFSDGSKVDMTKTVVWSSSQVAVAAVDASGLVISKNVGDTAITAAAKGVSGSATFTVFPPTLVSIALAPAGPTIPLGATQPFTATATLSDRSAQDMSTTVTWNSSAPAIVGINGLGLATARAIGTATITAKSGSVSASGTVTVGPAALLSLDIAPPALSVALGTVAHLSARGSYTDGTSRDMTKSGRWQSANPRIASVTPTGMVIAKQIGQTTISASSASVTGSSALTVAPMMAVSYFAAAQDPALGADAQIHLTNPGLTGGDLCDMIYVFDSSQEMNECCGCVVSQDGLRELSLNTDLTSNTLTRKRLHVGVIVVVPADAATNPSCDAGSITPAGTVAAWSSHIQRLSANQYAVTESEFQLAPLGSSELSMLQDDCSFIHKLGSGHGVCTCGTGD